LFVLSGFLVTGIILRDSQQLQVLRTFYIRRGFRIWPLVYLGHISYGPYLYHFVIMFLGDDIAMGSQWAAGSSGAMP
jgi:peptidoglycan/LPS O-acetylase OafA/YrhL